ncbi:hypothetical protein VFPPC_18740 [Pochonia chlamydosporia 170]|uniref:Uncharacterized protein n=1 Tax=Pochonia chlamydosporia 170 TaxID=1380566 RepID=A0A219ARX7_METCM|nr:hypothetical protein VFPPC_18740 [Pochonia chlamydosporia 170]OWT43533.1 hypothetical protein VFPPC_18740 [Pochonia chlamydosporia 170]
MLGIPGVQPTRLWLFRTPPSTHQSTSLSVIWASSAPFDRTPTILIVSSNLEIWDDGRLGRICLPCMRWHQPFEFSSSYQIPSGFLRRCLTTGLTGRRYREQGVGPVLCPSAY